MSVYKALPRGAKTLRIQSRSAIPAEVCETSDDPRRLGMALTELTLNGTAHALTSPRLTTGWHTPEAAWRWTNGAATLDLPPGALTFTIAAAHASWRRAA